MHQNKAVIFQVMKIPKPDVSFCLLCCRHSLSLWWMQQKTFARMWWRKLASVKTWLRLALRRFPSHALLWKMSSWSNLELISSIKLGTLEEHSNKIGYRIWIVCLCNRRFFECLCDSQETILRHSQRRKLSYRSDVFTRFKYLESPEVLPWSLMHAFLSYLVRVLVYDTQITFLWLKHFFFKPTDVLR